MTINSSPTFKLLLLVLGFVCALQVSSSASLSEQNQPQPLGDDDDAKIDKFRKFATKDGQMLSIKREAGHDAISSLEHRQCIATRLLSSLNHISKSLSVPSSYVQDLIVVPQINSEGGNALAEGSTANEQMAKPSKVFLVYLKAYLHSNPGTEDAVKSFVKIKEVSMKNNIEGTTEGKAELANYIVPLGENMYKYDEAIDYITKEHETHCINGVVHRYPLYYLELCRSTLLHSSVKLNKRKDDSIWINYMATACPFTEDAKPIDAVRMYNHLKYRAPLTLNDHDVMKRAIETPSEMSALWPHLLMIRHSTTNSDLISQLVDNLVKYKEMKVSQRKAHDEDLWEGYQKKFIVQQTIIRVMREDLDKAKQFLDDTKNKFKAKLSEWPTNSLPELIVHKVARPLYHHYQSGLNETDAYLKTKDMLKTVFTILFEQSNVQFELPKESELVTFVDREVAIPEEIKMLCPNLPTLGTLFYSQVIRTIVDNTRKFTYEQLSELIQDEIWAELGITIVSDLLEVTKIPGTGKENPPVGIPPSGSQIGDTSGSQNGATSGSQVTADPIWYKSPLKWVSKNPFDTLKIVGIAALIGFVGYKLIEPYLTPDLTTPFQNTTSPSPSVTTDPNPLPIVPVWLIVVIIVSILILGAVFYLIRRKKRMRSDDGKGKTSKTAESKTKKGDVPVSSTPTGIRPSSSSPGTSRPRSTKSSLVTSSPVSSRVRPASSPSRIPLIPSRISTPGPVKSALGKPIYSDGRFSTLSPASSLYSSTPSYFGSYVSSATASSNFLGGQSTSAMSSSAGGSTLSAVSTGGSTGSNVGSSVAGSSCPGSRVAGSNVTGSSVAPSSTISRVANSSAASAVTLSSIFSGAGPQAPKVAQPTKSPAKAPMPSSHTGTKSPDGKAPPTSPSTGKGATIKPGTGDPKGVQKKKK